LLNNPELAPAEKVLLRRISVRIATDDHMYIPGLARHYFGVGLSAMRSINRIVEHHSTPIHRILDMPCGHGRVLRFLRVAFDSANITACDLNESGIAFCERRLGAKAVRSIDDVGALHLLEQYDLIWCGSLITHFDDQHTRTLLRFFYEHLSPHGLCIFTTHGLATFRWLSDGVEDYDLDPSTKQKLLSGFEADGYGYTAYPGNPVANYGLSLTSFERMSAIGSNVASWSPVAFIERGWDDHQDVYAFARHWTGGPIIERRITGKTRMAIPCFDQRRSRAGPHLRTE
jgi:SAM-dependent methyltransferase